MTASPPKEFIIDADVLIDYRDSDCTVISLFSSQVGRLHIGRATFQKVKNFSEATANQLGLDIETPDEKLADKAQKRRGKLSYDDHEILLLAAQNSWVCITNDNALGAQCSTEEVERIRGLEPMKLLVKTGDLSLTKALKIAKMIQRNNPGFITEAILHQFEEQLRELVK